MVADDQHVDGRCGLLSDRDQPLGVVDRAGDRGRGFRHEHVARACFRDLSGAVSETARRCDVGSLDWGADREYREPGDHRIFAWRCDRQFRVCRF